MSKEIGDRLRALADDLGGVNKLAEVLEMKSQGLYRYFEGESMPGGTFLLKLERVGINSRWVLTGEGQMKFPAAKISPEEFGDIIGLTFDPDRPKEYDFETMPGYIASHIEFILGFASDDALKDFLYFLGDEDADDVLAANSKYAVAAYITNRFMSELGYTINRGNRR